MTMTTNIQEMTQKNAPPSPSPRERRLLESIHWFARHIPQCVFHTLLHQTLQQSVSSSSPSSTASATICQDTAFSLPCFDSSIISNTTNNDTNTNNDNTDIHNDTNTIHKSVNDSCSCCSKNRIAALLLVDISGFTRLSTILEVETLSKVINAYFEWIVDEVTDYQGDVLKFAGDALFASWPVSVQCRCKTSADADGSNWKEEEEEEVQRVTYLAAKCAASIAQKCSDFILSSSSFPSNSYPNDANNTSNPTSTISSSESTTSELKLNVHCGVGVGRITGIHVGDSHSRREYLVLGHPISQVSRAENVAKLGEVVASQEAVNVLVKAKMLSAEAVSVDQRRVVSVLGIQQVYRVISNRKDCYLKDYNKVGLFKCVSLKKKRSDDTLITSNHTNAAAMTINDDNTNADIKTVAAMNEMRQDEILRSHLKSVMLLENFRSLVSLYVHPVIRNDELDIYNTFGLNSNPHFNSRTFSSSSDNFTTMDLEDDRDTDAENTLRTSLEGRAQHTVAKVRHGAEAELRSVYTIFVKPLIDTSSLMNADSDPNSSAASHLINKLHQIMLIVTGILKKYKGHLRQYIVDDKGVVLIATFGLRGSACPNMLTKHALPATHAIYNLLIDDVDVKSKIGATFGRAYCGVVGGWKRHEFAVLGPSVNLAARLMAHIQNPSIVVDDNVRRMLSHSSSFKPLNPVTAKGYKRKVPIFVPSSRNIVDPLGEQTFVGRKNEILLALKTVDVLLQPTSKQYGKLILLSGAHGLGKSILASKICERIRAFIKHSKTDARSFSFFNAAAMKSDRLIPMCVFRNIFIDMIGDYVDRVRFQEMENDEADDDEFSAAISADSALSSSTNAKSNASALSALTQRLDISVNDLHFQKLEMTGISQEEVLQTLRNNANAAGVCASGEYSMTTRIKRLCKTLNYSPSVADMVLVSLLGLQSRHDSKNSRIIGPPPKLTDVVDFLTQAFIHCTKDLDLVVISLDNIHFMDSLSWKIISSLIENCSNILILGCINNKLLNECTKHSSNNVGLEVLTMLKSFSPDSVRHADIHKLQTLIEIPLEPFTIEEMRDFIATKTRVPASSLSKTFIQDVHSQCEGLPYFATVILDDVVKLNLSRRRNSSGMLGWRGEGGNGKSIPDTPLVQEFIRHRLDRYDVMLRTIVSICALLGDRFTFSDVLRIMPIWKHEITGDKSTLKFFHQLTYVNKLVYIKRLQNALDTAVSEGILEETVFGRNEWNEVDIQPERAIHSNTSQIDDESSCCDNYIDSSEYVDENIVESHYKRSSCECKSKTQSIQQVNKKSCCAKDAKKSSCYKENNGNGYVQMNARQLLPNEFDNNNTSDQFVCRCGKSGILCECRRDSIHSTFSKGPISGIHRMSSGLTLESSLSGISGRNMKRSSSFASFGSIDDGDGRTLGSDEQLDHYLDKIYQFKSFIWRQSVLSTLLQSRKKQLHKQVALSLEAEGFGYPMSNFEDNRNSLFLLEHWKQAEDMHKSCHLIFDIGKRYEEWGFSALAIDIYEDGIDIILDLNNISIDSNTSILGGFPRNILLKLSAIAVEYLVLLKVEMGKCYANLGNSSASGDNYMNAYHLIRDLASADQIKNRTIVFTIVSGLCLCLKWGAISDDSQSSFEQELIQRFIREAKAHGDLAHISRALALRGILFARLGNYDEAIQSHLELEQFYDPKTQSETISQYYGSDRAAQNFGLCAQWYDLNGDEENVWRCINFITHQIIPSQDERNTHNLFMIIFPVLWVLKQHKRSLEAKKLWDKSVVDIFLRYYGEGVSTWSDKFFKIVSLLLVLSAQDDDIANRNMLPPSDIDTHVMFILEDQFLKFTDDTERLINLGRDGRSIVAEICLHLVKLSHRAEYNDIFSLSNSIRFELIRKGLNFANASLTYLKHEEASSRSVTYALQQVVPVYEMLQLEEKKIWSTHFR